MSPSVRIGSLALPLFMAESTLDGVKSGAIGEWMVIGAAALVVVRIGWDFMDRLRGGSTQKAEITLAAQFATQKEHTELRAEIEKIDRERRTSVANLHEKIDLLATRIDERIDEIPGRTIALLNETKQLHKK